MTALAAVVQRPNESTTKPKELVIVNTYFCAIVERNGPADGNVWVMTAAWNDARPAWRR